METTCPAMPDEKKEPSEWEIDGWVNTLLQAAEIRQDPKKMALCNKRLKKKQMAIKSIQDLREYAGRKDEEA